MPSNSSEDKESSYVAVRLLSGLKEVYTFKELEELLDIPAQVLWRYTSHVQFPERGTAKKLLDTIQEKRLLERAVREIVLGPQGVVAEWKLLFNPRFLNIVGYLAWKHFGEDGIDLVLAPSERDSALAAVVADWLDADACAASERAWVNWGKLLSASYHSSERGEIVYLHLPRDAIEKGTRVLVAKGVTRDFESLPAIASIVEQAKGELAGAIAVAAIGDKWSASASKAGLKKVKVIVRKVGTGYELSL